MPLILPDLNPTVTSNNANVQNKVFTITRSDTTGTVKAVLPKDATVVDIQIRSTAASNAGTTAVISVGTSATATEWVASQSVLSGGLAAGAVSYPALAATTLPVTPLAADQPVYGKYAETGTASSAGGPWVVRISYVR